MRLDVVGEAEATQQEWGALCEASSVILTNHVAKDISFNPFANEIFHTSSLPTTDQDDDDDDDDDDFGAFESAPLPTLPTTAKPTDHFKAQIFFPTHAHESENLLVLDPDSDHLPLNYRDKSTVSTDTPLISDLDFAPSVQSRPSVFSRAARVFGRFSEGRMFGGRCFE
jgi:hypothetical protein